MSDPAETTPLPPRSGRGRVRRRLTPEESAQRRRRFFTWTLSIGLGILLVNALVGESGYLATLRAQHEEASLRQQYYQLHLENERLRQERIRLQQDPRALEEAGRELGLIRDGETKVTIRRLDPPADATPAP